jgi:hypothetical protein
MAVITTFEGWLIQASLDEPEEIYSLYVAVQNGT